MHATVLQNAWAGLQKANQAKFGPQQQFCPAFSLCFCESGIFIYLVACKKSRNWSPFDQFLLSWCQKVAQNQQKVSLRGQFLFLPRPLKRLLAINPLKQQNAIQQYSNLMQKLNLLISNYSSQQTEERTTRTTSKIAEFQSLLSHFTKLDIASPLKLKFGQAHASFLLKHIADAPHHQNMNFTTVIQILNHLLRQSPLLKLQAPNNLMAALTAHLTNCASYLNSPAVIANVIWLVGRCFQMSSSRATLILKLSQSKLIETCLGSASFESTTERGLSLLMTYLEKQQLIQKQFSLILVPNLHKFKQRETMKEVLALLRRIGTESIKNNMEALQLLGEYLLQYFNQEITEGDKNINWELAVLVAHAHPHFTHPICIKDLISTLVAQPTLLIKEESLNKVNELASLVFSADQEQQEILMQAVPHVFANPIARRLFIQYHEQITSELFIEIISGPLPAIMAEKINSGEQRDKALKLLICLKRSASQLGLDVFYQFKFKALCLNLLQGISKSGSSLELIDLWRDVSGSASVSTDDGWQY